jgi:hypothetical protein
VLGMGPVGSALDGKERRQRRSAKEAEKIGNRSKRRLGKTGRIQTRFDTWTGSRLPYWHGNCYYSLFVWLA